MNDIAKLIKRAALEAIKESDPMALMVGTVLSTSPLQVNIEQRLTLSTAQLMMADYIHNKLVLGDQVILLKMQGGQKYLILDKVVIA
jgi:hypothetical protein